MKIEYEDNRTKKIFLDFDQLYTIMGFDLQKKLKLTLNRLEAAINFREFLNLGLGKPHSLQNNLKGYYGVTLSGNVRLIVKPAEEDLDSTVFVLKGVCDYHGSKEEWIIP